MDEPSQDIGSPLTLSFRVSRLFGQYYTMSSEEQSDLQAKWHRHFKQQRIGFVHFLLRLDHADLEDKVLWHIDRSKTPTPLILNDH